MSESNHPQHDPLEAELERMLRRKEPSPGFAAPPLASAQAAREDAGTGNAPRTVNRWRRFAAAAALFAMVSSGGLYMLHTERQSEQQRAAAEEAGRQALMALRITAGTLAVAREKVLEAGKAADRPSQGEQQ